MTEQTTANLCLTAICCLWPGLWAFVAFNVGRHGLRGWWRILLARVKAFGGDYARQ